MPLFDLKEAGCLNKGRDWTYESQHGSTHDDGRITPHDMDFGRHESAQLKLESKHFQVYMCVYYKSQESGRPV